MRRVAVLGGGISGLAAAFRLHRLTQTAHRPVETLLLEREARAGGCMQTERTGGFVMELGPDSVLASKPAFSNLLHELDLDSQVVRTPPEFKFTYIAQGGTLRRIAPEELRAALPFATKASAQGLPADLVSLRDGLGAIPQAISARLGERVRTGATVTALRRAGNGWSIELDGGEAIVADALICALPARSAAAVLYETDPQLAQLLLQIRYGAVATVNLAYDAAQTAAIPPSTGFVVPAAEGRSITAATFSSQKYPGRAPAGSTLIRAFIGAQLLDRPDDELAAIAQADLSALAQVRGAAAFSVVQRWNDYLPESGGRDRRLLDAIAERIRQAHAGLTLTGAAYGGVGIPDCIASGESAVEHLFAGAAVDDSGNVP
jgi:protoporphyrinogen oxidase